ncbi:unnamed protein product, partial [Durusdinium trenchii]
GEASGGGRGSVRGTSTDWIRSCQSVEHEAQHADVGEARGACSQGGGACQG